MSGASERNDEVEDENPVLREVETSVEPTPLPKFQLFLVLLVQFAEPVTATVIYPFVNQFVRETGITGGDEAKTGYYAGIIESAFFLAEALTVFYWGKLSDRYGRRPVLLIGPLGLAFAMFSFGLSSTFWPLVVYRCLQGMFNGNLGVSKTVIAELTDSTNIGNAFSFIPFMWSCGITIAPTIGGALSYPAERWPNTLGKISVLRDHPYFLPCFVAGMIALTSFSISLVGLKETHPSFVRKGKSRATANRREHTGGEPDASTSLLSDSERQNYHTSDEPWEAEEADVAEAEHDGKPPPVRSILTRRVVLLCINYGFLAFTDMSNQVLTPLMMSTSIEYGGLGFDPYIIGTMMGAWGFTNAFVQICFLGRLIRRFGARRLYMFSYAGFIGGILCFPLASYLATKAGQVDAQVYAVIALQLAFRLLISMCYGSVHVLVVESAPSKASLGSLNGLTQTVGSVIRSVAPSFASSLFSISLQKHLLGGHLVYYIFLAVAVLGVQSAKMMPPKER